MPDDVLDMTLQNITMYNAVIPSFEGKSENKKNIINADDPDNKDLVDKILFG